MSDDKGAKADTKAAEKKAAEKKPTPKPAYVVGPGRSIAAGGRIFQEGDSITADEVSDMEALVKGGYVVKA